MKSRFKQRQANRRNAKHSTGPITPEGKAVSSQNSTTHGLSSAFLVLPHEDKTVFDQLLATYSSEFNPQTEHERFLVSELAQSRCRLDRVRRFEAAALEQMLTGEFDKTNPDADIVQRMSYKCKNILDTLLRYATAAERSYHRAHRELTQARSKQKQNEANDAQTWLKEQIESTPMPVWDDPPAPFPFAGRPTPISRPTHHPPGPSPIGS